MSVMPGFGGQKFDPAVLAKVRRIRAARPGLRISIDGGIKPDTAADAVAAGVTQLVAGSAVFRPDGNYAAALAELAGAPAAASERGDAPAPSGRRGVPRMTQVVLIRPGATVYDEQNRVQGVLDIPLSDRGRAEVARLAADLPATLDGLTLAALYCGPGESVVRTAEAVGKALGLRPKRIDDLRNLDQGLWQGLQIDEIKRRNLRVFRQWLDDPLTVCPPWARPSRTPWSGSRPP